MLPMLPAPSKTAKLKPALPLAANPIEFRVGTDALAVVVSAENDFVTALTKEQLGKIFTGEFTTWNQVDASFPAEAIVVYSPGADSGTFDYFIEAVLLLLPSMLKARPILMLAEEALLGLEGAQFSEDDNVLVQGVEGSPYAIGYFGFAYFAENSGALKAVAIDGVEPNRSNRGRWHLPARPPALHLLGCEHSRREAPGCRVHLLLPEQRQ